MYENVPVQGVCYTPEIEKLSSHYARFSALISGFSDKKTLLLAAFHYILTSTFLTVCLACYSVHASSFNAVVSSLL